MELALILFLILLNGFFAMAEIAIVSSRKSKLQQLNIKGNKNAKTALELAQNPDKFFPTIQIGITLISILAGAIGQATLAIPISDFINKVSIIAPYHDALSFLVVVGGITYVSLIIGELVPKHIAINNPERIALFVAPSMQALLKATLPIVKFLSLSSEFVLKFLRIKPSLTSSISEDEVRLLMSEGTRVGIFNLIEKKLVDRVLHLDSLYVDSLMTPRKNIQWFDINKFSTEFNNYLTDYKHSKIILSNKTLDNLLGVVRVREYLRHYKNNPNVDIKKYIKNPHLIPENTPAIKALELFRKSPMHTALIIDEYGAVQGLVTFNDVLEAIVGDIQARNWVDELKIVKRSNNSYLLDGMLMLEELKSALKLETLSEKTYKNVTLGGFVIAQLNKIPTEGDKFEWQGYKFEVVDMDNNRVDKILAKKITL